MGVIVSQHSKIPYKCRTSPWISEGAQKSTVKVNAWLGGKRAAVKLIKFIDFPHFSTHTQLLDGVCVLFARLSAVDSRNIEFYYALNAQILQFTRRNESSSSVVTEHKSRRKKKKNKVETSRTVVYNVDVKFLFSSQKKRVCVRCSCPFPTQAHNIIVPNEEWRAEKRWARVSGEIALNVPWIPNIDAAHVCDVQTTHHIKSSKKALKVLVNEVISNSTVCVFNFSPAFFFGTSARVHSSSSSPPPPSHVEFRRNDEHTESRREHTKRGTRKRFTEFFGHRWIVCTFINI